MPKYCLGDQNYRIYFSRWIQVTLIPFFFRLAKSGLSFEAMFEEIPLVIRNSSLINSLLCEVEVLSPHTQTDNFLSLSTGYGSFEFIFS